MTAKWKEDGWLTFRRHPQRPGWWIADTMLDVRTALAVLGQMAFPDAEYDKMLAMAGQRDFGIETREEETS